MRKSFFFLLFFALMCGVAGNAGATVWTGEQDFSPNLYLGKGDTGSFSIAVTPDFQIPFDLLNSAELTIIAENNSNNTQVKISGHATIIGYDEWTWEWYDDGFLDFGDWVTSFSVTSAFSTTNWPAGSSLAGTIKNNTNSFFDVLIIDEIQLKLDYTNQTAPPAVPEPSTLLLLGSGLVGVVVLRKRFKKA